MTTDLGSNSSDLTYEHWLNRMAYFGGGGAIVPWPPLAGL
jgi:hypothetical protein